MLIFIPPAGTYRFGEYTMSLNNEGLREVHAILVPPASVNSSSQTQTITEGEEKEVLENSQDQVPQVKETEPLLNAPSKPSNSSVSTTSNAEFIPHLFYALHQIRKDPNNSANHLDTATGFIRHRLKVCKSLIEKSEDCKRLLSNSTEEWHGYLRNREKELQVKRDVLRALAGKLEAIKDANGPDSLVH